MLHNQAKCVVVCICHLVEKKDKDIELVSKKLNNLAAILHVYAGGLNFMK